MRARESARVIGIILPFTLQSRNASVLALEVWQLQPFIETNCIILLPISLILPAEVHQQNFLFTNQFPVVVRLLFHNDQAKLFDRAFVS